MGNLKTWKLAAGGGTSLSQSWGTEWHACIGRNKVVERGYKVGKA